MSSIQLVTRGDDAGSSRSANRAIRQCCEEGILRNVSVMACGPAFEDAVRVLDDLSHVDFGLHVCLSAEWDAPRWSSVAPREQVPSLLDESAMFTSTPQVLRDRGFSTEEALLEIEAQLTQLRAAGIKVSYIDEHMGVSWIHPDLRAGIAEIARRESLIDAHGFNGLGGVDTTTDNSAQQLITRLSSTQSGAYLIVTHPMFDDDEARGFQGAGTKWRTDRAQP
jgi:predicted glycoside hydrolase/deacetylase ChbG (UPF0249 family)